MPLPQAPGRRCHGRPRPGTRRMMRRSELVAEPQIVAEPLPSWYRSGHVRTCSAPFCRIPSRVPEPREKKTAGRRLLGARTRKDCRAIQKVTALCDEQTHSALLAPLGLDGVSLGFAPG